jgi:hypothetical protein
VGDEDARTKPVGVAAQPFDIGHAVAGLVARTKTGAADVDGVGTVVDGLDADVGVSRWGQQFKFWAGHVYKAPQDMCVRPIMNERWL